MRWSCVVLILLTIQLINCDPLDKTENENRLKTCGKFMKSKVFQGRDAKQIEAPWSVFFLLKDKITKFATSCTGSIVSPRHVLISTHCFAGFEDGETEWKMEGRSLDRSKCQKDDYVITDENYLRRIFIQSNNKKNIALAPEKVTLVNACLKRKPVKTVAYENVTAYYYLDDFAIIDLYEELAFSDSLQPVCVAESKDANAVGTDLNFFGYGLNPPTDEDVTDLTDDNTGVLRHETVQIVDKIMEDYYFRASNQKGKTISCKGDSGGGAIADINDQKTIVGVLSQSSSCANKDNRGKGIAQEQYASVGYYSDHICRLTGICKATTDYEKNHKGYIKKEKPVRKLEELVPPEQGGPGSQNGQEGAQIVIQNEPDSAFGIVFNWILVLIIFVLNF